MYNITVTFLSTNVPGSKKSLKTVYENITKESNTEMNNMAVMEVRVVVEPALVAKTIVAPSVAVGITASLIPFIASAASDRAANPTEGGSYRNTEYTFFSEIMLTSTHARNEARVVSAHQECIANDPLRHVG